mgnify:CR=1 FL=1
MSITPDVLETEFSLTTAATRLDFLSRRDSGDTALNTVRDITGRFGVGPGDRVFALSALSFDLSVYDVYGTLAAGATYGALSATPFITKALAEGADGVECDVHLTEDLELVCIHDTTLDRTSSGTGDVGDHTLRQLRELDFASWKGANIPPGYGGVADQHGDRGVLPALRARLEVAAVDARIGLAHGRSEIELRMGEQRQALVA